MKFIAFLTEFRKGGGQIGFVLRFRNTKGKTEPEWNRFIFRLSSIPTRLSIFS